MLQDLAKEQEIQTGKVNISALSKMTGHDRKTIRKYLSKPLDYPHQYRHLKAGKLDPFKGYLESRIEQFPFLSSIRLLEEIRNQGYDGGYTIVKDYIRTIRPKRSVIAEIRYETKPGVQAQVDWSDCLYLTFDGETKRINCFSMILGYSRMRYVEFTTSTDIQTFLLCHQHAFDYFGGVTQEILYDNMKVVVIKRKNPSTTSDFHSSFVDFRDHYGFTSYLCRPYRAKTKGKIERAIRYIKENFLYGRFFSSIDDLNNRAYEWMEKVNHQVHGTTLEVPYIRHKEEQLCPISSIPPYQIKRRFERIISKDSFISLFGNRYSVPWKYARQNAIVEVAGNRVIVAVDGEVICEHNLLSGKNELSKNKEHFEGLLKAVRDESYGKMPPVIPKERPGSSEPSVVKRSLSEYDLICGGEKR